MTANQCVGSVYPNCVNPAEQRRHYTIDWKATQRVAITCGGSALIGFFGKGGWWGVGLGGANCLWGVWRENQG